MYKNNWPYQKFHDANKNNSKSSFIWGSLSYEYNNSGKIKKVHYQWEKKKKSCESIISSLI